MRPLTRSTVALRAVLGLALVAALLVGLGSPAAGDDKKDPDGIVVKVEAGVDLEALAADHKLVVAGPIVESVGMYRLEIDPDPDGKPLKRKKLKSTAKRIAKEDGVVYAEADRRGSYAQDDRFHPWPNGLPVGVGDDPDAWLGQGAVADLRLGEVHWLATGAGVTVAVLDTGADLDHPSLVDAIVDGGYDYVDDDPVPEDEADGTDDDGDGMVDESFGHGTHTAGLVALIAPEADIVVYRVLDADGVGDPYVIAEAIDDAVAAGVDVINMSFGMEEKTKSKVVRNAFKRAARADVVIVAAAGNDGEKSSQYPAEDSDVIGVGAMGEGNERLASFSNHGNVALVAAPGENIISAAPGGGFASWSGTSMATPIVTGQVALVQSHSSEREFKRIVKRIGDSSHKLNGKRKVKRGRIDILASLRDS